VVGHESRVLQQAIRLGLPAEPTPALELAAGMPQHAYLPGVGKARRQPLEVEIGEHQLEQDPRLPTEERRNSLA
jgi:hypothetical protein